MGLVRARIELANAKNPAVRPMTVDSLVDTRALLLCVPEHVAVQLGLEELEKREVTTADGTTHLAPYVGPVLVRFENRQCLQVRWCSAATADGATHLAVLRGACVNRMVKFENRQCRADRRIGTGR